MSKFGNVQTVVRGRKFASKAEADHYMVLLGRLQRGEISKLRLQPRYLLQKAFVDQTGKRHLAITYVADFEFEEAGQLVAEDVKGVHTDVFSIKWKMAIYRYPAIVFRIVQV